MKTSDRQRLLEEWRGLPQIEPAPDRMVLIEPVLRSLLVGLGFSERIDEQEIAKEWKSIVGDFLALHSQPTNLQDGCLIVRVTEPTVRYELDRNYRAKILKTLQEKFGKRKIRDMRFQM